MPTVVNEKTGGDSTDATVDHTAYKILRTHSEPSEFRSYDLERISLARFVNGLEELNSWFSDLTSAADSFISGVFSRADLLETLQNQQEIAVSLCKNYPQLDGAQELTRLFRDTIRYTKLHDNNAVRIYLPLLMGLLEEQIMAIGHQTYCSNKDNPSKGLMVVPRTERADAFKHHLAQLQMLSAGIDSLMRRKTTCFKALEQTDSNSGGSPLGEVLGANIALRACFCTSVGRVEHEWYPDSQGQECLPSIPLIDTELLYKAHVLLEILGEHCMDAKADKPMLEILEQLTDIMHDEFLWQRWNVPGAWNSSISQEERKQISAAIDSSVLPTSSEMAIALGQSATGSLDEEGGMPEDSKLLETLKQIQTVQAQRKAFYPQNNSFQLLRYDNYAAIAGMYLYPNPQVVEEMWQIQKSRAIPSGACGPQNGILTPIDKDSLRSLVHMNMARIFLLQCDKETIGYCLACTNSRFFPPIMTKIEQEVQRRGLFQDKQIAYAALAVTQPDALAKMSKFGKSPYRLLHETLFDSIRLSAREEEHYTALCLCRIGETPARSLRIHKRFGWQEVEGVTIKEKEWTFDDKEVEVEYQLLSLDVN